MKIRDRIKELRRVKAKDLVPNPKNWRTHPKKQQDALKGLLAEIGYADALLARELPDGSLMLVDGHLRAETTPNEKVPVLVLDVTEEEADKLLLSLDPLAAMAEASTEALGKLLQANPSQNAAVQAMFDDLAASNNIEIFADGGELPDIQETTRHSCVFPYEDADVPVLLNFLGVKELPNMLGKALRERICLIVAKDASPS